MKALFSALALATSVSAAAFGLFPANGAQNVNIDTGLKITFNGEPQRGASGWIRVYDAATGAAVDSIDLSLPDGFTESRLYADTCHYSYTTYDYSRNTVPTNRTVLPGTPSGEAEPTPRDMQLNIIGGFTDGFRFRPVICRGNEANIKLHNNMLDYGRTYRVVIEPEVIDGVDFPGTEWTFSTKGAPTHSHIINVAADGSADFTTIQGALDAVPDFSREPWTIVIAPGDYEEIVYARNKTNLNIVGAGMDSTLAHYANNEVFNPHPLLVKTHERRGTFPSRRAAFMLDNCHDIIIRDITIATDLTGQAEGLLLNGERIALFNVHIIGSGDALQANGTVYMEGCEIDGSTDTILGRGVVFAKNCNLRNDGGHFTWVRNTRGEHGDVFVDCTFSCPDGRMFDFGRTPFNKGSSYPNAEMVVINCRVRNLNPSGWSVIGEPTAYMWEYNTTDLDTGQPVDTSSRHPYSRQLDPVTDAAIIDCYSNPAFILNGWFPPHP